MTALRSSPADILNEIEATAERRETPCGAGRMVWRIWGEGPPLALLHGGYGSWRHWIRNIPHFRGRFRLLVPDIPGLGDSDDPPEATPESIGEVVARGLEALVPPQEKLDLAGFSFGSLIAGHVATFYPHDLASLTLIGAGALGTPRSNIMLDRTDPGMSAAEQREINRKNLSLLMIADPAKIDDLAILIQETNVALARVKSRRFANSPSLTDALRHSRPDRLNAIWGGKDVVVGGYFEERETLLRSIRSDVSFNIIPDAGHWVSYEAPGPFNALLDSLLIK